MKIPRMGYLGDFGRITAESVTMVRMRFDGIGDHAVSCDFCVDC